MKIQLFQEKEQHFQEMHTFCAPVRKRQYSLGIIDGFGGACAVEIVFLLRKREHRIQLFP